MKASMNDFGVRTLDLKAARLISKVASRYMRACSFGGIEFREDSSEVVKQKGGILTRGNEIRFDPAFLNNVNEKTLAFLLAHELGEKWFAESFERIGRRSLARLKPSQRRNPKAVGLQRRIRKEVDKLEDQDDNYADVYAIRKLFESGWHQQKLDDCLVDCRIHLQSYFSRIGRGGEMASQLDDWLSLIRVGCYYLWVEFQRAQESN